MQIFVSPHHFDAEPRNAFVLFHDNWNDWWRWETLYNVRYFDALGDESDIGYTKIASADDMRGRRPNLPDVFETLPRSFFSLGQDPDFYSELMALPGRIGKRFLSAVNDVVANPSLFDEHADDEAMTESLLRNVSHASVHGQFQRIVAGEDRLQEFDIRYVEPSTEEQLEPVQVQFVVSPDSLPPTNIHVLIGRNGSGKTRLLRRMAEALIDGHSSARSNRFITDENLPIRKSLSGVGFVAFSAFDRSPPLRSGEPGFNVFDIGLRKRVRRRDSAGRPRSDVRLKTYNDIEREMGEALHACSTRSLERWQQAVETLESDPLFARVEASKLAEGISSEGLSAAAVRIFRELSSGHQIVLLTITSIVAHLEERTLVLMDEPEGHLHPPLLSALIRAISQLLAELNAFAIVATHSPVVLQEVPAKCVHLVARTSGGLRIQSPSIETFGENVGVLTREVFGLEVEASGFHRLITNITLEKGPSLEAILREFDGELGGEAAAHIMALLGNSNANVELEF